MTFNQYRFWIRTISYHPWTVGATSGTAQAAMSYSVSGTLQRICSLFGRISPHHSLEWSVLPKIQLGFVSAVYCGMVKTLHINPQEHRWSRRESWAANTYSIDSPTITLTWRVGHANPTASDKSLPCYHPPLVSHPRTSADDSVVALCVLGYVFGQTWETPTGDAIWDPQTKVKPAAPHHLLPCHLILYHPISSTC